MEYIGYVFCVLLVVFVIIHGMVLGIEKVEMGMRRRQCHKNGYGDVVRLNKFNMYYCVDRDRETGELFFVPYATVIESE